MSRTFSYNDKGKAAGLFITCLQNGFKGAGGWCASTPPVTCASAADPPASQTLCSMHLSSSFQVSRYSSGPQGRHTLSEAGVHLEDRYVP